MSKFTEVDLWFTEDGDFKVGSDGDLKGTEDSFGRAVLQEIRDRVRSKRGEWKLFASIGSNLESYLGEPGTSQNITRASQEIERSLTFDRMMLPGEMEVVPLQIARDVAMFRIIVFTREGELSATLGYDSNRQRFIGY